MPAFRLPRLKFNLPIVDGKGNPAAYFLRFWNDEVATTIERNEAQQAETIAGLQEAFDAIQAIAAVAQAAQQAANAAQETADGGGAFTTSGSATGAVEGGDSGWQLGPQVDLTAAVVGNLRITGTGPQQDGTTVTTQNMSGSFRVVEIIGMVETPVFTGSYSIYAGDPATVLNESAAAVSAFSLARTSTGAVSYRIDTQRTDGGPIEIGVNLPLYIYARRAA